MYKETQKIIFEILEGTEASGPNGRAVTFFMTVLIFLNIIAVALETVEPFHFQYAELFNIFEIFSIIIFTLEYVLRLWTCDLRADFNEHVKNRLRYAMTPMAVADLLSVLPFYLPIFLTLDLRTIKVLRLLRLFRIAKLGRYSAVFKMFKEIIREKKEELFLSAFLIFIALVISSSLMYFIEHEAQPEKFSSIPAAMWWGIVTLATIGYGDVYPITPLGKFFGAIVALFGIGMFALPAGIFASGFIEQVQKNSETHKICPHCGKDIDEKLR
ncbi:MAG: ion transporter [Candidatus Paceibacterota bacterium]|jgi:voltage-gated potassium channel